MPQSPEAHEPGPPRQSAAPASTDEPFGELEEKMLRLLARADGGAVYFQDAANELNVARLILENACNSLLERRLIEVQEHYVYGFGILLTPRGKKLVINRGFPLGGRDERGFPL